MGRIRLLRLLRRRGGEKELVAELQEISGRVDVEVEKKPESIDIVVEEKEAGVVVDEAAAVTAPDPKASDNLPPRKVEKTRERSTAKKSTAKKK